MQKRASQFAKKDYHTISVTQRLSSLVEIQTYRMPHSLRFCFHKRLNGIHTEYLQNPPRSTRPFGFQLSSSSIHTSI